MNKGFFAFLLGLLVSFLFGVGFMYIEKPIEDVSTTVYYLQTGVYQTHENAIKMQTEVQNLGSTSYIYQKDDLYYVICAITSNKDELASLKALLEDKEMNYVQKEITIELENKDENIIEKVLEGLAL